MEVFADPYYDSVWKTFKTTLIFHRLSAAGVWETSKPYQDEFKNVLAEYVNGTYNDKTVEKHLNAAADRVNEARREK